MAYTVYTNLKTLINCKLNSKSERHLFQNHNISEPQYTAEKLCPDHVAVSTFLAK